MWIPIAELVALLLFGCAIALLPRGHWRIGRLRRPDEFSPDATMRRNDLQEIRDRLSTIELREIESRLAAMLSAETSKEKKYEYFVKKIFAAIDYAVKRHDWFEDQRARIFQASMTLMTGVLTIIAIVVKPSTTLNTSQEIVLASLGIITLVSVIRMVLLYNRELDADRPYRLIADIRFWFYRYNLPRLGSRLASSDAVKMAQGVAKEREKFVSRLMENESLSRSVREDLEQLFILHTLQRSKSESLTAMQWALSYFLIFGSVQVILFGLASRLLP